MSITTKELIASGDQQVTANPAWYRGIVLQDATGDAYVRVYKGTAATQANLIDVVACSDEKQADRSVVPGKGIYCSAGIYADVNNGDLAVIWYEPEGAMSPAAV